METARPTPSESPAAGSVRSARAVRRDGMLARGQRALRALLTRSIELECDSIPYRLDRLPLRKVVNWILVEAGIAMGRQRPWGLPTHLQIEPTTHCNLRCTLCPVTEGMERPHAHMDPGLFRQLIDQAGEHALLAILWDWGEPFVHPRIFELISYAKQKQMALVCSTNGHPLANPTNARRLVESGLDTVIFAVDGITQESYQRYRHPGKLETVLQAVRNVVDQKRLLGSRTPLVVFRFIVMRQNEHEIPELKRLALDLGVDVLSLKSLNPYSNDVYHENREEKEDDFHAFLPGNPAYRRFAYRERDGALERIGRTPPCKSLWNAPTIHFDGHVVPCTYDYNDTHLHGDLRHQPFREIWHGASYARMRDQFLEDWRELPACRHCSFAYEGGSCVDETIVGTFYSERVAERFARPESPDRVAPLERDETVR